MTAFITALILTLLLLGVSMPLAITCGLVAEPGDHRQHQGLVPLTGGISMLLAFGITVTLYYPGFDLGLGLALTLLLLVGVLDDRYALPYWSRFLVQGIAVLLIVYVDGTRLTDLGRVFSPELAGLGSYSTALTMFAVVGVINTVNMVDGMDGLSASLILVCLAGSGWLVVNAGLDGVEIISMLIAIVLGFLCLNLRFPWRKQARVFMGDAGSMTLGLLLAWILVHYSQGQERAFVPVMALWLLAIPLFDAVGVLLRRSIRRGSPFKADWIHTHHLLQKSGLGINATLGVMVAAAVVMAMSGIILQQKGVEEHKMFYIFISLFVIYLGAMEWGAFKLRQVSSSESSVE